MYEEAVSENDEVIARLEGELADLEAQIAAARPQLTHKPSAGLERAEDSTSTHVVVPEILTEGDLSEHPLPAGA